MSSMTVPERICDFLIKRLERMYCDTCIQERLGLKWRQQVQLITATLAVTNLFEREFNRCCTCQEMKQVTRAADSQAGTKVQKTGVGRSPLPRSQTEGVTPIEQRMSELGPSRSFPLIGP